MSVDIKNIDWQGIVRTVAPSIASIFGGPLAGMAAQAVSNAVLGKPDGTEAELAQAMAGATPETLIALKKADQEFAEKMKEAGVELEKINAADRDSARKREIEVKDRVPGELAVMVFFGFFGVLGALMFVKVPPEAHDPLVLMLGALGSLVVTIATYYYGSSSGSDKKNDIFADALKGKDK